MEFVKINLLELITQKMMKFSQLFNNIEEA